MLNVFIYEFGEVSDIFRNAAVSAFILLKILLRNHI